MSGSARLTCCLRCVVVAGVAAAGGARVEAGGDAHVDLRLARWRRSLLDLYLPANPIRRPVPVIVFLHGGGWSGGTRTTGPDFKRYFAQDGFATASIEYRLTPAITFPANVEDVRTAVRWLKANAAAHGLAADRICLWGSSAGGHLAAVAGAGAAGHVRGHRQPESDERGALRARRLRADPLRSHGCPDRAGARHPAAAGRDHHPGRRRGGARGAGGPPAAGASAADLAAGARASRRSGVAGSRLLGAAVQTVPDRVRDASPITYLVADAPPFLIMHGLADGSVPHGQSVLFTRR